MRECGGCTGSGRHRRWCEAVVGRSASIMGRQGEQAEALADQVGPNHMTAANHLYRAAGALNLEAAERAQEWMATHGTAH